MSGEAPGQNGDEQLEDPEPISLALGIFTALSGAAGVIIPMAQYIRTRRQSTGEIRKQLFAGDRALNRLDEAYRDLISIYDEHEILGSPFTLGQSSIYANERLRGDLARLRANIFYGGRDLQDALTDLGALLERRDQDYAHEIAGQLEDLFQKARRADRYLEFMIQLGEMLEIISQFIYRLGQRYNFDPKSPRITLLRETLERLRSR